MSTDTVKVDTVKTGKLVYDGLASLGRTQYHWWKCVDCGDIFPAVNYTDFPTCNRRELSVCPWCGPREEMAFYPFDAKVGEMLGNQWVESLFDNNSYPEQRQTLLHYSILAELGSTRFFSPLDGNRVQIGHRVWRLF